MATALYVGISAFLGTLVGTWLANRYEPLERIERSRHLPIPSGRGGPALIKRPAERRAPRANDDEKAWRAERDEIEKG